MIPRRLLNLLVFALILLLVVFAVLMAFFALVTTLGDRVGATALFWAANTCLVLLVVDMVLLLVCLGLRAIDQRGGPGDASDE